MILHANDDDYYLPNISIRLLFDAALSGVQVEQRLALHGGDVRGRPLGSLTEQPYQ